MTPLQIAQLIAALLGAAKDIQSIHDELHAQGHPDNVSVSDAHAAAVLGALASVNSAAPPDVQSQLAQMLGR